LFSTTLLADRNQRMVAQLAMKMQAKPAAPDVAALSWWLPNFLPLSAENRHRFLEMSGAKERLAEATRICASVMEVGPGARSHHAPHLHRRR